MSTKDDTTRLLDIQELIVVGYEIKEEGILLHYSPPSLPSLIKGEGVQMPATISFKSSSP